MKNGRIILKATLTNASPIGIGSGSDEHSDRDIVTTLYPIDANCRILPPEKISEATFLKELPYLPATSFMGKIDTFFVNKDDSFATLWGRTNGTETNASFIDCSDILLTEMPEYARNNSCNLTEIRDGIRIDSSKGTVAKGAKFDYELLGPDAKFGLTMIFRVETAMSFNKTTRKEEEIILSDYGTALGIASAITQIVHNGFDLGAKSTVGYGKMKGETQLFELDFEKNNDFRNWISNDLEHNPTKAITTKYFQANNDHFEIDATFQIKNSLIIRSYSKDPNAPDSTHLKSGGNNILSGSSIKGAMRGRAERILNTIQNNAEITKTVLASLFGDVEKQPDGITVKKDGYTVPSRVFVDEIPIVDVKEEIQTRIQIDRFTGGTVDGALIEEVPLFPVKDMDHIKNFRIRIKDAQPLDKGLMLLLLKDLWTADLPIGGEKAIGRGVLKGINAKLTDGTITYHLLDDFKDPTKVKVLQGYVDTLHSEGIETYYKERVHEFKTREK